MTKSKVGEVRVIGTNLNNKDIVDFTIVTNNSNSKEKSKSNRITDDIILEMISLLEDEKSVIETANILSISVASVYKYAKEFNIKIKSTRGRKQKTNTEENKIEKIIPNENKLLITRNTVIAGLIKDRHQLPVDDYIFDNIDSVLMFDYKKLDDIVKDFIKLHNISTCTDLIVYVTGLVSANASLIKVCSELNINLTLMHYNEDTGIYNAQPIFYFNKYSELNSLFSDSTFLGFYDCNGDIVKSDNYFWKLSVVDFNSKDKNNRIVETLVFDNNEKLWREFSKVINIIMTEKETRKTIFVYKCKWNNDTQSVDCTNISQTCNFR